MKIRVPAWKMFLTADGQRWTKQRNQTIRWGTMGPLKLQQEWLKHPISYTWSHLSWLPRALAISVLSGVLIIPRADIKLLHQYILALVGTSISSYCSVPMPNQPLNMASICLIIAKFIIHSVLLFSNIRLPTLVLTCVYNFFHTPPIKKKWSLNSSPLDYGLALVTRFYNIKCNGNDTTGLPKLGNLKAVQPPPWCTNTLPSASLSQELALWCFLPNQHAVKKPSSRSHRRRSSQQPSSATRCERSSPHDTSTSHSLTAATWKTGSNSHPAEPSAGQSHRTGRERERER